MLVCLFLKQNKLKYVVCNKTVSLITLGEEQDYITHKKGIVIQYVLIMSNLIQ